MIKIVQGKTRVVTKLVTTSNGQGYYLVKTISLDTNTLNRMTVYKLQFKY